MSLSAIGFSLSALVSLGIASRHIWHGPHVKFSFSFRFKQFLSFRFIFCQIFIDSHISANIFTFFFHSTQVLIYSFFFCKSIFLFIILLIFLFSFCSEQCIFYKLVFLFSNIFCGQTTTSPCLGICASASGRFLFHCGHFFLICICIFS